MAINGRVEVRPILPLTATIDHRYTDGWHISNLIRPFKAYLNDPASHEPDPTSAELRVAVPTGAT